VRREHLIPIVILLAGVGYWYFTRQRASVPLLATGGDFPTPKAAEPKAVSNVISLSQARAQARPYGMTAQARGIRNNNPGNIKITNNAWKGKLPVSKNTDGTFEQFETPEHGIRALFIDLRSKLKRGLNTVEKIIPVYAPATDNNDVMSYIMSVVTESGLPANKVLSVVDLPAIIPAIIKHENGFNPYSGAQLKKAYSMV
jgi:hypothetical protein